MIKVPAWMPSLIQYAGATASWLGEGDAANVSVGTFERFTGLKPYKVAAITVMTKEVLDASEGEAIVRRDLTRACVAAVDAALLDPTNAGSTIKPASILNSVTESGGPSSPSGTTDDVRDMIGDFTGDLDAAVFVTTPLIGALLHSSDNLDVGARGGSLYGVPLITSRNCPAGVLSWSTPRPSWRSLVSRRFLSLTRARLRCRTPRRTMRLRRRLRR